MATQRYSIILSTVLALPLVVTQSYDDASTVYTHIKNSSTSVRPVQNQSHTIEVSVIFYLIAITQVDEVRQELTCNAWLNLSWTDEVRAWNSSLYGNLDLVHPMPTDIWRPRVMVSNSLQDRDIFKDDHAYLTMFSDGRVSWYPGGIFFTNCKMAMTIFPFDTHDCSIRFLSINYYVSEVLFVPSVDQIRKGSYSENGEWSLESSEVLPFLPAFGEESFTGFIVTLTLTRRPAFFLLNVVLPLMLLSLLNFMVFLLPAKSGEKITFGTTILLTQAVFLTVVTDILPSNSDSIPLVLVYLLCVLLLCSLAVAVSIITAAKADRKTNQTKQDGKVLSASKQTVNTPGELLSKKRSASLKDRSDEATTEEKCQADREVNQNHMFQNLKLFLCSGTGMFLVFITLWSVLSISFIAYGKDQARQRH